jgi:hypothetical protein
MMMLLLQYLGDRTENNDARFIKEKMIGLENFSAEVTADWKYHRRPSTRWIPLDVSVATDVQNSTNETLEVHMLSITCLSEGFGSSFDMPTVFGINVYQHLCLNTFV